LLDQQSGGNAHHASLQQQLARLDNPDLTPSAQVLRAIAAEGNSFPRFALKQSQQLAADFRARPPSAAERAYFSNLAQASIAEQTQMEQEQTGSFDEFIEDYRSRTSSQLCCEN
jgi:glutamate--cysteine ligase